MNVRGARRPSLRRAVAATLVGASVLALAAAAAVHPATPARDAGPLAVSADKPPTRLPDGCGDTPNTDGRAPNTPGEILCGGPGNDTIRAGFADSVRAGAGADTIWANNAGPNYIDGGAGSDTAYVDRDRRLDRMVGVQRRYTALSRPQTPAARRDVSPRGFPYNLPTVKCSDARDGSGDHLITLLDTLGPGHPQLAAFDANSGVVDWQYVAWTTLIRKWDPAAKVWNTYAQTDWLWDHTYDLPDYTAKKHPRNVWHSFTEGDDDDEAAQEPFKVTEPGDYSVRFIYYWYSESVPDLPDRDLANMPSNKYQVSAKEITGDYAGPKDKPKFYCRFP